MLEVVTCGVQKIPTTDRQEWPVRSVHFQWRFGLPWRVDCEYIGLVHRASPPCSRAMLPQRSASRYAFTRGPLELVRGFDSGQGCYQGSPAMIFTSSASRLPAMCPAAPSMTCWIVPRVARRTEVFGFGEAS